MNKGEIKINHATYIFNPDDSFVGQDGQRISFISIRKVKFDKTSNKPKNQVLTISQRDKGEVFEWLRKCLS